MSDRKWMVVPDFSGVRMPKADFGRPTMTTGDVLILPLQGFQPPPGWTMLDDKFAYRLVDGTEPDWVALDENTGIRLEDIPWYPAERWSDDYAREMLEANDE